MGRSSVLCLLLALTLSACRSKPEEAAAPPPPPPPAVDEPVPSMPPPVSLADVEPDAYCEVENWDYERRGGIWVPADYADQPVAGTARLGENPEWDQKIARRNREPFLKLGPTVRVLLGGEVIEISNDDMTRQYEGVVCEPRGKVRLPRNLGPMGTSLEERLRRDNRTEWGRVRAEFVVERDGRVGKLVESNLLPQYEDFLLQDLREVQFQPGTLDGKPVAVLHTVDLTY